MLQTIYEADSSITAEWRRRSLDTHAAAVGSDSEGLSASGTSEVSMLDWDRDSDDWEKQLQRELLLIQRQQQIQKQLLISEFQKQHQNLLRQHQAQLEEHIKVQPSHREPAHNFGKLQQALLTLRQQQEVFAEERRLMCEEEREEVREDEKELHRRETQKHQHHRRKERSKESAMASTEVRQKLHDFLMSKSAKDPSVSGAGYPLSHSKLWYSSAHPGPAEQSSPPLGETPPTFKYPLTSGLDYREDFPLRKTASEPNLKVRSRLKQKVSERRSGPIRRRDGSVLVTPMKKRTLELTDSSANESPAGSGPSSPIGLCGNENGASYRSSTSQIERCLSQSGVLHTDGSLSLLNLYTSPSLPNLTLALHPAHAHLCTGTALKDRSTEGLAACPVSLDSKASNGQQALLQHLLLKEQRQQRMISPVTGSVPVLSSSPLAMKERASASARVRLPRHRPLNRTQSAPLPQSALAQLVLQQQHHNFVEKQKQFHQQVHISQVLSQSIDQLRNSSTHLEEEEEEEEEHREPEITSPPAGVIRSRSFRNTHTEPRVIRLKTEPEDGEIEDVREKGTGGDAGEEQKEMCAPLKRSDDERRLENMTET
ncbi:histone deacetylase 9-B isoform X1 [Pimephales promelas]|uniref:histone deacetylase 9-B isoform X1 n=1 Tax=Pimephales promelas TaxID=90988 RepID=UPI00195560F1|nr:histone deacetylase 9-B isoform X1 [Pimephales promelas]XP_039534334.1 histone deacetylase 9-B isoform X1 [Pimephales promelas]XP_039534335.1 histone deacetylase 9-B isoform X1 [Pimephales promelas]KAG1948348.1 histone deacetylase [Pimephales promelas]